LTATDYGGLISEHAVRVRREPDRRPVVSSQRRPRLDDYQWRDRISPDASQSAPADPKTSGSIAPDILSPLAALTSVNGSAPIRR
jgi:hypothetical protein